MQFNFKALYVSLLLFGFILSDIDSAEARRKIKRRSATIKVSYICQEDGTIHKVTYRGRRVIGRTTIEDPEKYIQLLIENGEMRQADKLEAAYNECKKSDPPPTPTATSTATRTFTPTPPAPTTTPTRTPIPPTPTSTPVPPKPTSTPAVPTATPTATPTSTSGGGGGANNGVNCAAYVPNKISTNITHYVCPNGSDSGPGTLSQPWKTAQHAVAQLNKLPGGTTIAFCRDGVFPVSGSMFVYNRQCNASTPCTIRDYGNGLKKPRLVGAGGHLFRIENGGNAIDDGGYVLANLELQGQLSQGAPAGAGIFIYNGVKDTLIQDLEINDFALGVQIAGSNPPASGNDGLNERIKVQGCTITNNRSQGFLGSGNGVEVKYNTFDNNGFGRINLDHNLYWGKAGNNIPSNNGVIACNTLVRSTVISGKCQGAHLVVHGEHNDLLIEGNIITESPGVAAANCWGIAADGGYSANTATGYTGYEVFRRLIIRGNTVANVGNIAIGCQGCVDSVIENNSIINYQGFGVTGIAVPNKAPNNIDEPVSNITIRNNSVYYGPGTYGVGIRLGTQGISHAVNSNVVRYEGASSSFSCFDFNLPLNTTSYESIDYNSCSFDTNRVNSIRWAAQSSVSSDPLAAWQSVSSFDSNSKVADPMFKDPIMFDLSSKASTAGTINSGHPTMSSPNDMFGIARDSKPDMGSTEF
ncbi:MAG: right-handed parallel beta-helix repeat-containing protein [Deltaproteobacteria bacterium]|nr:right-handed parallel beta-helix repeat-containing protein [Deltaproteobacteria bacterium]